MTNNVEIERSLLFAVEEGDCDRIRELCEEHPWLIVKDRLWIESHTWMGAAAHKGNVGVVALLLDLGFNIDACGSGGKPPALTIALGRENDELVKLLLDRGANPNLERTMITAGNVVNAERRMRYFEWLVEAGVELNQRFSLYGNDDVRFTVLDGMDKSFPDEAAFLRKHGAKTSKELA